VGAYILTGVILLVLALLLYRLQISKSMVNAGITLTYIISSFFAGYLAGKKMKQKRFVWGLIMGSAYFIILLVLSFLVNQAAGTISNSFFTTLILCAGGGMLGGMLS
jgi:putative membrane protein (TIGR04086 family)